MMDSYVSIIDQLEEELLPFQDEEYLVMDKPFMRFKFRTNDQLKYNQKMNIPICVISLSCIVKKGVYYYPQFRLQKCFYESDEN